MEWQILVIKHHIDGSLKLPGKKEMLKSYENDVQNLPNKDPAYLFWPKPFEGWKMIDDIYELVKQNY